MPYIDACCKHVDIDETCVVVSDKTQHNMLKSFVCVLAGVCEQGQDKKDLLGKHSFLV